MKRSMGCFEEILSLHNAIDEPPNTISRSYTHVVLPSTIQDNFALIKINNLVISMYLAVSKTHNDNTNTN
jgi:hypothetical protein